MKIIYNKEVITHNPSDYDTESYLVEAEVVKYVDGKYYVMQCDELVCVDSNLIEDIFI